VETTARLLQYRPCCTALKLYLRRGEIRENPSLNMRNPRQHIPLYPNPPPPESSPEHAPVSNADLWYFPPIRIRKSPTPEQSPYPPTQPRIEHYDSAELENKNPSQTSPKGQAKRPHKPKSGLRARNVLNTAGNDVYKKVSPNSIHLQNVINLLR